MDAAFEFFTKIGTPYYCFHDVDLVSPGNSIAEYEKNMQGIVEYAKTTIETTRRGAANGPSECLNAEKTYDIGVTKSE